MVRVCRTVAAVSGPGAGGPPRCSAQPTPAAPSRHAAGPPPRHRALRRAVRAVRAGIICAGIICAGIVSAGIVRGPLGERLCGGLDRWPAQQAGQRRQPGQLGPAVGARGQVPYHLRAVGRRDRAGQVHAQLRSDTGTRTCIIHVIAPPSHLGRRLALPGITVAPDHEFTHRRGSPACGYRRRVGMSRTAVATPPRPGPARKLCVDATAPAVVAALPDLNTDEAAKRFTK